MKVTTTKAGLAPALAEAARIVENRNIIPILANVHLETRGDDALVLSVTDMDMVLTLRVPAQVEAEGATTVEARMLADLVRRLADGAQITLSAPSNDPRATLVSGRARYMLATLPAQDWPEFSAATFSHRFLLEPKVLARLLARTLPVAPSSDKARPYLEGVHLSCGSDSLDAAATTSKVLVVTSAAAPEGAAGMPDAIIPKKACERILAMATGDTAMTMSVSRTAIEVANETATFRTKLFDGIFPDYRRIIPAGLDKQAIVERGDLANAIDRVGLLAADKRGIVFEFVAGEPLKLSMNGLDRGEAREEIDLDYDAAPVTTAFSRTQIGAVLNAFDSDTVLFKLADAGTPPVIQARDGGDTLAVIMPMPVAGPPRGDDE